MTSLQPPFDHNREYYASFTPPYETLSDVWNGHFGRAAAQVIEEINPKSIIDAGCAVGVLVRQFAKRGVDAYGFDSSVDAIEIAHESDPGLVEKVVLHDISKPFPYLADAVICIEVVEHLEADLAAAAISTLCRSALKYVVFSSTPDDVDSPQHPNVQPAAYWDQLFLDAGFKRTSIPAWKFCPWATVYERKGEYPIDPEPEMVMEYEAELIPKEVVLSVLAETKEFPALQEIVEGEALTSAALEAPAKKSRKKSG